MKSHALAAELLALPDSEVTTEGCDCDGDVGSVSFDPDQESWDPETNVASRGPVVTLERS